MREQPEIPEECLRACLQDQYDLIPVTRTCMQPICSETGTITCL